MNMGATASPVALSSGTGKLERRVCQVVSFPYTEKDKFVCRINFNCQHSSGTSGYLHTDEHSDTVLH